MRANVIISCITDVSSEVSVNCIILYWDRSEECRKTKGTGFNRMANRNNNNNSNNDRTPDNLIRDANRMLLQTWAVNNSQSLSIKKLPEFAEVWAAYLLSTIRFISDKSNGFVGRVHYLNVVCLSYCIGLLLVLFLYCYWWQIFILIYLTLKWILRNMRQR